MGGIFSRAGRSTKSDFPERAGRSIKSDFPERAVLEIRLLEERDFAELEVQGFSRHPQNFKVGEFVFKTACSGKGDFLERPVLENGQALAARGICLLRRRAAPGQAI